MLIIPAIDLKDGCVVRFTQGRFNKKKYSRNPLKTARHWVSQGAKFLHIVDLDGALTGKPKNLSFVEEIVKNVSVPVQFGGGIRDIETIKKILKIGVGRVVLGTKAIEDKNFLKRAFSLFKEKIIVSVDAQKSQLLVEGWQKSKKNLDLLDFVNYLKELGFKEFIYTDTIKDGTLSGPNIKMIKKLLKIGLRMIASGGISSLEDIFKLKTLEKNGLIGIIIGKALYEGKFTLKEALKIG